MYDALAAMHVGIGIGIIPNHSSPSISSLLLYKANTPATAAATPTPMYPTTFSPLATPVLLTPAAPVPLAAALALVVLPNASLIALCAFWLFPS
jgi:hypothetical protein